ncbi:MAG: pyridoxamine 5'-phosphate oxidase family protein [Gammaproteobacteria bacterium]|nr:pyridoxamine 5'-phosphate oxidase family protein [Gammaproteobacteria bacterium]
MTTMTQPEKETFLAGLHVGVLSIAREGRGPLTAPIWYGYAPGGDIRVMIGRNSRKARLLALGTRVSLCAQRESAPYAYVTAEGPVVKIEDGTGDDILELATRYLGPDEGRAYADSMPTGSSLTVTVRPETWLAVDYTSA